VCGICGVVAADGAPIDPHAVRRMVDALAHRGPDAWGMIEAPGVVAAIRRLRVIDLATGDQPIASEDGAVEVVYNGEIYNHEDLRRELSARGHRFRTRADTEVLVHLWEERGPELVTALEGMFAFCIVDRRRREVFLARDAMGVKPLFLRRLPGKLLFASETAALRRFPGPAPTLDPVRLIDLVALQYVPGRRTPWLEIEKLLPGESLHITPQGEKRTRWLLPPPILPGDQQTGRPAAAQLRALLEEAVRAQSVADVPLGVFLSGGLDSSGIAALLARSSPGRVKTFSVGFDQAPTHDERAEAASVSRALGTEHHELVVSAGDVARVLPDAIAHLEEPVLDPALLPTWLLARFARREVTVALSGEGADELFGGYKRHLFQQRLGWMRMLPGLAPLARTGRRLGWIPPRVGQALEALGTSDPVRNHLEWSQTIARSLAGSLFDDELVERFEEDAYETFAPYFQAAPDALSSRLAADLSEWLPHDLLAKVDRATMAFSLEARVPYLAGPVVRFASQLPDDLKIRGGESKFLLREALADVLPERVLQRAKKGFDLPLGAWLKGPLRDLADTALAPAALAAWPGLKPREAASLWGKHRSGSQDFGLPMFNLVSVSLFLGSHAR
jgi:asparagine synthase (glutamine-hydrolysing)